MQLYYVQVNVKGLIFAGCGDLKSKLANYAHLDARIKSKILTIVDIAHGQKAGFHEVCIVCRSYRVYKNM